jgi:hypothetical protein
MTFVDNLSGANGSLKTWMEGIDDQHRKAIRDYRTR